MLPNMAGVNKPLMIKIIHKGCLEPNSCQNRVGVGWTLCYFLSLVYVSLGEISSHFLNEQEVMGILSIRDTQNKFSEQ